MPREKLANLTDRWPAASKTHFTFEAKDAIRQHVGASIIIEGDLSGSRAGMKFTGTLIDPERGVVRDLSFTSKSSSLENMQKELKLKLEKAMGMRLPQAKAGMSGTKNTAAYTAYWKGVWNYENGKPDKAYTLFETAAKKDSSFKAPRLLMGRILLDKALFTQATALIRPMADAKTNDPRPHFLLGLTYYLQRQSSLARSEFLRAIDIEPDNPEYHYQLGLLDKEVFRFGEALEQFTKASALDSSLYDAWYQAGVIYSLMKQEKKALDALENAAKWGGPVIVERMRNDSDLAWLRDNVRFQTILVKSMRPKY